MENRKHSIVQKGGQKVVMFEMGLARWLSLRTVP
jgi:hypothetical protein